jgi:hypothetical protein
MNVLRIGRVCLSVCLLACLLSDTTYHISITSDLTVLHYRTNLMLVILVQYNCHFTNQLMPRNRVLPEKLTVLSTGQELPRFLWNRRFINVFTGVQYPQAHKSSPHTHPIQIHFNIIQPSAHRSLEWSLPFGIFNLNLVRISHLPHACYMPRPSHPPWFYHSNIIWWKLQITKFAITEFSPVSYHLIPLKSKYSPRHPVLKTPSVYILPLTWDF